MKIVIYLTLFLNLLGLSIAADTVKILDKTSGLSSWVLSDNGLELTLKQAYPDQIRAFYLARGFPDNIAADIADSCMFQTIVKNTLEKGEVITIPQALWQVKTEIKTAGIKLKQTWDKQWQGNKQIKPASRLAYRWATFPTEQRFEPKGDYNWGMTCFDLKPKTRFDVKVVWQLGDKEKSQWIRGLQCAYDNDKAKTNKD